MIANEIKAHIKYYGSDPSKYIVVVSDGKDKLEASYRRKDITQEDAIIKTKQRFKELTNGS